MLMLALRRLLSAGLFLLLCVEVYTQDFDNYQPLKCEGEVPALFKEYVKDRAMAGVDSAKKNKSSNKFSTRVLTDYHVGNAFFLEQMLSGGRITYGDEVTLYLQKILDTILWEDKALRNSLSIFTLRCTAVNAFITGSGHIFVTTGLLSRINSEAELAYILCHEINHFVYKHSFLNLERTAKLRKEAGFNYSKFEKGIKKLYKFSRENELQADMEGLTLFLKTAYADTASISGLKILENMEQPFLTSNTLNKSWVENSRFKLQGKLNERIDKQLKSAGKISDDEEENDDDDGEEKGERSPEEEEDLRTHPDLDLRIGKIRETLADSDKKSKDSLLFLVGEEEFLKIKKLSQYETLYLNLIDGNYGSGYYLSESLKEKYGESHFLSKVGAYCLYKTLLYRNNDADMDELGYDYKRATGAWKEFFVVCNVLSRKEITSVILNKLNSLTKIKPDSFINELNASALELVAGDVNFNKDVYYRYFINRGDSIVKSDKSRYLLMLGDLLKDTTYIGKLFIAESEEGENEERVSQIKKRSTRRKRVDFDKTVMFAPYFYQYKSTGKRKSISSKLLSTAEVKNEINSRMTEYQSQPGWNYLLLGTGSNPLITTDEINQFSALTYWLTESFSQSEIEIRQKKNIRFTKEYLPATLADREYLAVSGLMYSKFFRPFSYEACVASVVLVFIIPYYLYWQLAPAHYQNYFIIVYNLKSGAYETAYTKKFRSRLAKDVLDSHLYDLLYSVKGGTK